MKRPAGSRRTRAEGWEYRLHDLLVEHPDLDAIMDRNLYFAGRSGCLPFPVRERFVDGVSGPLHLEPEMQWPAVYKPALSERYRVMRSIGDKRNWGKCFLRNELDFALESSNDFVLGERIRELLSIIPVNETLWKHCRDMSVDLDDVIQRARKKYTVEDIRRSFTVLLVGHSKIDLEDRRRPKDELFDNLATCDWLNVDLTGNPLCNDIEPRHREDLPVNLLEVTLDGLGRCMPLGHFEAIVTVYLPVPLRTQAFTNFAALLRPGGHLILSHENIVPGAVIPSCLDGVVCPFAPVWRKLQVGSQCACAALGSQCSCLAARPTAKL